METLEELSALLRVKECDLRENLLIQCQYAVDRGIHSGGAESAILPMAALYYGGILRYDVKNPVSPDQDIFILSKGHAVAALAAVYSELGYFSKDHLKNSRGWDSLIKGHPGPVIPGVPVATGPLGQGISLASGYALKKKEEGGFDVYCLAGDGELQEGSCWEGIQFAGEYRLDNLCVLVDKNNGQSDDTHKLFLSAENLNQRFSAFGFRVFEVESSNIPQLLETLRTFRRFPRDSRPTAIICETIKGFGAYSITGGKHKTGFTDDEFAGERNLLAHARDLRVRELNRFNRDAVKTLAENMGYSLVSDGNGRITDLKVKDVPVTATQPPPRNKALRYNPAKLPQPEKGRAYGATEIAEGFAGVFAADPNFFTIDADLSNVSGLYTGTRRTNRYHGLNVGIAECNMMCIAEALAAEGANVWVSTFGPFFNWQAFRRIAVSYQERKEVIEKSGGWLSEGHNLDITFLSTASNIDTAVNGATHMSNDDICFFNSLAHVKLIDTCCPRQFLAAARWIAQGGRGLVYLRVMRSPSPALYDKDYEFEYGKGHLLRQEEKPKAVIISSGHAVLESLKAAELLAGENIPVSVADMPSYDGGLLGDLAKTGIYLLFAEQNNGALFDRFSRDIQKRKIPVRPGQIIAMNTRDREDELHFIQSGSYEQIIEALGLTAADIFSVVKQL
jgi:transketolase